MSVAITLLLLVLVIVLHEASHAFVATKLGFEINQIFVGVPIQPKVTFQKNDLKVTLSPWIFGGGVKIDNDEFYKSTFIEKFAIAISGPLANLVLGISTSCLVFGKKQGLRISKELIFATVKSIQLLITGAVKPKQIVGPVGLTEVGTKIVSIDPLMGTLLMWLLLNFAVGILNLMPIPALDGGQILLGLVTSIWGNSKKVINFAKIVTTLFFFVLLSGLVVLTIKDVLNLFG